MSTCLRTVVVYAQILDLYHQKKSFGSFCWYKIKVYKSSGRLDSYYRMKACCLLTEQTFTTVQFFYQTLKIVSHEKDRIKTVSYILIPFYPLFDAKKEFSGLFVQQIENIERRNVHHISRKYFSFINLLRPAFVVFVRFIRALAFQGHMQNKRFKKTSICTFKSLCK